MEYEEGNWINGELSGYGIRAWRKKLDDLYQSKYVGGFKNDAMNGYGKYWYSLGAVFEGFFDCCSENKPFQTGKMTYKNGKVEEGTWQ